MTTMSSKKYRLVRDDLGSERKWNDEGINEMQGNVIATSHFAGFWMRFWAFLLDMLVVLSLNGILIFPALRLLGNENELVQTILTACIFFLYFAIMTKNYGQTVGKMVFGLRVVSKDEGQLTWLQVFFREGVGRLLHQLFFFLYILYVVVAFTAKKQGLHDMIADTYVIHKRDDK